MNKISHLITLGVLCFCTFSNAQLASTGFEGLSDESVFNLSSWTAQGFTVPWVNGFNQNRAHVDNAFAKSGTNSLRITYPANQFGPPNSGAQAPLMMTPANQLYMSYWVRFSDNFDYGNSSEGGKLPGLGGGGRCSGCAVCTGSNGFTARLMWRTGGRLVLYLYHLDKSNPPCGDNNTLVVGGSDYYITKGQWFQVTQRVKVNTGSNHDGEVELWINGQPALLRTGIQFVSNGDKVDNLYFSTFHGGNDINWVPSTTVYTWFDDIRISPNAADVFQPLSVSEQEDYSSIKQDQLNEIPQPLKCDQTFRISLGNESEDNLDICWYDHSGRKIKCLNQQSDVVKVPTLSPGLYVLFAENGYKSFQKKVMVIE